MKVICIPILTLISFFIIAVMLQSCGVVRVDHIKSPPLMQEFDKVNVALWILGATIAIGVIFSWFIYNKITILENRIKQINYGE